MGNAQDLVKLANVILERFPQSATDTGPEKSEGE